MKSLNGLQPLGLLVLRLGLGLIFFTHGYPKLAHSGSGMQGFFIQHGLPGYFVFVSGVLEVFGGGLLIAGLFTRGAALLLAIETGLVLGRFMVSSAGIYAFGRYEMPLLLEAMAVALVTTGAGAISIDAFTFESGRKSVKKPKAKD